LQTSSSFLKMPSFRSSRSVAASTTKSAFFMSSRLVLFLIRLRISVFWSAFDLVLGDEPVQVLGDRVESPVDELVGDVVHDDIDPAGVRSNLADAVAHLTSPMTPIVLIAILLTLLACICY